MASKRVRPFTPAWRWLIGLSSVGAFLGGWAVLAHTPNPYETAAASTTVVEPTSVPTKNTNNSQNSQRSSPIVPLPTAEVEETVPQVQPTTPAVQSQRSMTRTGRQPRVRTGGS